MSKQIDERVVSMEFDNRNFERNVRTSMSTLDKLKSKLSFKGTADGLDTVSSSIKKINFNPLTHGINTVQAQFSALEVMGVTALANITNQAVNAGKRIANALTIQPVITGFQEYETQINAVQTILANTQSKGSTIEDVNKALDELNKYADMTIYNFTEMTRNIGTFTAAGVDLDKSVQSIKGIANLAAVSGSNSQQAATAMYQLSQALAAGKVSLMDWNSVVNAGMGGELFQNALIRTARTMGTGVDEALAKYGTFRESLTKGAWLTADVLTETLAQLSGAYTEADLIAQGYTEEQAKEIAQLAQTATDAATKVKTFTQLWDTIKEATQSGWTQTWELIIGDFEEAKELLTGISDFFTGDEGIITKMSNARNNLLAGALEGNPLSELADKINTVTGATDAMVTATKNYGDIVDQVLAGKFGNGEERFKALTEAGYDWAHAQNLVNEKLGDSTRHATDYKEAQEDVNKAQATTVEQLVKMNDAQLKTLGFTDAEIEALRELSVQSEKTGIPIQKLAEDLTQLNGRTLLINSFKNAAQGLIKVFSSIGKAWRDVFPAMQSDQLYNMIAALHRFSTTLIMSDENAEKLRRTFRGLFSVIDLITSVVGGGFKLAFQVLGRVLDSFGLNILDVTAYLGDAVYNFNNFVNSTGFIQAAVKGAADGIVYFINIVRDLINAIGGMTVVQNIFNNVKNGVTSFADAGRNTIEGFIQGIQDGTSSAIDLVINLGKNLLDAICKVLGIHSPSTEMMEVGENVIEGLSIGVQSGLGKIKEVLTKVANTIINTIKNIDWGTVIALGITVASFATLWKFINVLENLTSPLDGLGNVFDALADRIRPDKLTTMSSAVKNFAIAIGVLVGSILVLSNIETAKLWMSIGALTAVMGVLAGFSVLMGKFGPKETLSFGGFALAVLSISTAILGLTFALKRLEGLDPSKFPVILAGIGVTIGALTTVLLASAQLVKSTDAKAISKVGNIFIKFSIALLLMTAAIKIMAGMSVGDIAKGTAAIAAFTAVFAVLGTISKNNKSISGLGSTLIKMSASMLVLIAVIKLVSGLSVEEVLKGSLAITAFIGILGLLSKVTSLANSKGVTGLSKTLLGMTASMLILTLVIKMLGGMSVGDIVKGTAAITAFSGVIALLIAVMKLAGPEMPKLTTTLLAMSASIAILAAVAVAIGLVPIENLVKGVAVVGVLSTFMAGLILATKGTQNVMKNLIVLTVAVAMLAGAVAGLSLIDTEKLLASTVSLSSIMLSFGAMGKLTNGANLSIKAIGTMAVVVGLLSGVLVLLSKLPIDSALANSASLSMLMLSFSGAMKLMSTVGTVGVNTLAAVGTMTLVMAAVATVVGIMSKLEIDASLETASALSVLLVSFAAAAKILSTIGPLAKGAVTGAGAMLVLIGVTALVLAAVAGLVTFIPELDEFLNKGIPVLNTIAYAIGSFFGNIVGGFSAGASSGLPEIATNISGFIENLEPGMNKLKTFGDGTVLDGVKSVIGVVGAITAADLLSKITSFLSFGQDPMTKFKTMLDSFADAVISFSDKITGQIDEGAVTAAANAGLMLSEMQKNIQGAGGLDTAIFGTKDIGAFGEQMKAFGEAIVGFSKTVSAEGAINTEAVEAAKNAGLIMVELQNAIKPVGGLMQDFLGTQDLGIFGEQLKKFGEAIVAFSKTVSVEGAVNSGAIEAAKNAGLMMTELQKAVVPVGGIQLLLGSQDLTSFGLQLVSFGNAITKFSSIVSQEGAINQDAVEAAASAGMLMAEMQSAVEPVGLVQTLLGSKDLTSFGNQIYNFGRAVAGFSNVIVENGGIDQSAVESAKNAGVMMANLQKALPESHWFDGKMDLTEFGDDMRVFGNAIKLYSQSVNGIDSASIDTSISASNKLINLTKRIVELDDSGISSFASIKDIGDALKKYNDKISKANFDAISSSVDAITELIGAINSMAGLNSSGVESFKTAMSSFGNDGVNSFVEAFNNAKSTIVGLGTNLINSVIEGFDGNASRLLTTANNITGDMSTSISKKRGEFTKSAEGLMTSFIAGIDAKRTAISTAMTNMLSTARNTINTAYSTFVAAGRYFVEGFAKGISTNTYQAEAKAAAMARAARRAAEKEVEIESPSKVMEKDGQYFVQGFAKGINDETDSATDAAKTFAAKAYDEVSEVIWDKEAFLNDTREKFNAQAVEQEEAHWQNLFDARNAAAEASKEQTIEMVDFEEEMLEKTNQILDNYTNEFNSKADSIMNQANLFDEITKPDEEDIPSKGDLTKNLQDQVNQYQQFYDVVESLNQKIGEGLLKDYINDLSVDSLYELEALNAMTEEELNKYVDLFHQKFRLAKETALIQTEGLATDTEDQLSELYGGIKVDLPKFQNTYDGSIQSIKQYMQQSFAQQNFEQAWNEFKETGSYVADGFKAGILSKAGDIADAAVSLAQNAIAAVEDELDVNSPSKVFFKIGRFTGQGFINGLKEYADKSYNAASAMADRARAGLSATVNRISDLVNNDIDVNPTIRPVVDITDVTAKAKSISDLMSMNTSTTVRADVGAISFGMNRLRQNGPNDDVISAINKLRSELGNVGGNTYNVNGVTYDDGSNVSDAVRSLIRAARIDRRV